MWRPAIPTTSPLTGRVSGVWEVSLYMVTLVIAFASAVLWFQIFPLILASGRIVIGRGRFPNVGSAKMWSMVLLTSMLFALPIVIWDNPSRLYYLALECLMLLSALLITRNSAAYLKAIKITLLLMQSIILIFLIREGLDDFPLDRFIPNASNNGVTSYLILLQVSYCLVLYAIEQRIAFFTAGITLGITIVGGGRGSISAALALLLVNFVFFSANYRVKFRFLKWVLVVVVCSGVIVYMVPILDFFTENTKFGLAIDDAHRIAMIDDYLSKIDGFSLVFGADYNWTVIETDYNGNPHNSYIRAHHMFGLFYLLAVLALPIAIGLKNSRPEIALYALLMNLIILFRAFTEPILFPTLLDLFYFSSSFILMNLSAQPRDTIRVTK